MKDIDLLAIERYNGAVDAGQMPEDKLQIERFLKATIIHLEEDAKRLKNSTYLTGLYRLAIQAEEKVLKKQKLEMDDFHKLNVYNQAKVKEIKWLAVATAMLIIIAAAFRFWLP